MDLKTLSVFIGVATLTIVVADSDWTLAQATAFECSVRVSEPRPGQDVASRIAVELSATVPDGYHLWVFARRSDFGPLWWPQGEASRDATTGKWRAFATLGEPLDIGYDFDVTAAVVEREQHVQLHDDLLKAMKSGEFRPTEMSPAACIASTVKIKKTRR